MCTDRYRGRYLIIAEILSLLQIFLLFIIRWRLFLHFQATEQAARREKKRDFFFLLLFCLGAELLFGCVVWIEAPAPSFSHPIPQAELSLSHCRLFSSWCVKGLTVSRVKSSGAYGHKIQIQIQKKVSCSFFFSVLFLAGS